MPKGGNVLRRVWALAPGLLLCAIACGKGGAESPGPSNEPVRVEVVNRHPLAVEVYAFGTGIERRLGTVEPGMRASFVVPPNLTTSGDVELQVSPAASKQRFRSGELLLAPGSIVDLIVAPQLFSSTATIRP
jgi:hypothetical protein